MQAKFKTKTYDCVDVRQSNSNDGANALTLALTNVEDIDELIAEATDCDLIEILDDGVVTQRYEDYINFMSESLAGEVVEIAVCQPSLVQQVVNLKATVREQEATIEAQAATIAEQETQLASLEESQEVQDGYIDYISMMTDVDLPTEDDGEEEE